MKKTVFLICIFFLSYIACAKDNTYSITIQKDAWASNAGGQKAYGLRLAVNDKNEYFIFTNEALLVEEYPLIGAGYAQRYALFSRVWPLRFFAQFGLGLSSAGPLLELTFSLVNLWVFRVDISSHVYFSLPRTIIWNYPLWLGITIPF